MEKKMKWIMSQMEANHTKGNSNWFEKMRMLWMRYSKYVVNCFSNDTIYGGVAIVILKLLSVS